MSPSSPSGAASAAPLQLSLPINVADSTSLAYTIWPFGVHGSSHALDGHPGFDFEFRPGSPVLAPADVTVGNRFPDNNAPAEREIIQLRYPGVPQDYLIDITNLINVPSSVQVGTRVTRGQVIGTAGPMAIGTNVSPSAMIHFGLSDPNTNEPNIAPHSVSPDKFMTPDARAQLAAIWQNAAYVSEWCEPFLDNDRAALFPKSRAWTLGSASSGATPARIVAGCTENGATQYSFVDGSGATLETGSMSVGWSARPTTVDFTSSTGTRRLGLYDIVSETMRLSLGAAGAARPASFSGASTYSTQK
jgi:hypothetical protein